MAAAKPTTIPEYKAWLKAEHKVDITTAAENYYMAVVQKIRQDFEAGAFWTGLAKRLAETDDQYVFETGYSLLTERKIPELKTKPFDSFVLKGFRKNVLTNPAWPNPPSDGWVLPANWFAKTGDLVRGEIVVKYIDGVEYLCKALCTYAQETGLERKTFFEAREEGYYAAHLYLTQSFEIPGPNWDTVRVTSSIEIRVTTQLQEAIARLLHCYYEKRREVPAQPNEKWQWNYTSDEFTASYLGHILHYVEAMIVEIRDKQQKGAGHG